MAIINYEVLADGYDICIIDGFEDSLEFAAKEFAEMHRDDKPFEGLVAVRRVGSVDWCFYDVIVEAEPVYYANAVSPEMADIVTANDIKNLQNWIGEFANDTN